MKINLTPHGQPGALLAICGFDGSGKSTLEAALLAAITPTRPCTSTYVPTQWWQRDPNVRRSLFAVGTGEELPEEALLHFSLADCHAHQASMVMPTLARGKFVIVNRYLYDILALFEARGLTPPTWLPDAAMRIVRPDFCFVLVGPAELLVDRVVRRDGPTPGRFDQDVPFVECYNAALMRMAKANHLTMLRADADPGEILRQCLDALRGAGWL